jgi:hypothetical protein
MTNQPQQPISYESQHGFIEPVSILLDRAEKRIGKLGVGAHHLEADFLLLLDEISARLEAYQGGAADRAAAQTQFDYILTMVKKQAPRILAELGGAHKLATLREAVTPGRERWWWYLDEKINRDRRSTVRRMIRYAAGALLITAVLVTAYQLFLAPDPAVLALIRHEQSIELYLEQGDFNAALAEAEQALVINPARPGDAGIVRRCADRRR